VLVVEGCVALDFFDAVEADLLCDPIEEIFARPHIPGFVMIFSSPYLTFLRGLDANIDIFREPIDY